jgi:hypothetical protein
VLSILDAWTALEALSPQSYRKPEDLVGGQRERVIPLREGALPWERGGEPNPPKQRLYYQVLLGELRLDAAYSALQKRYAEDAPELPSSRPFTPLAVVVCDRNGVPQRDSASISSLAWGLPIALEGRLDGLGKWTRESRRLNGALMRRVNDLSGEGDDRPLTSETLAAVRTWLLSTLELDERFVQPPGFALRDPKYIFERDAPEPFLLNSFFLGDLARARSAFAKRKAPEALRRYLGAIVPKSPRNLLRDDGALADLLSPGRTPLARWPGPGRPSLVTLQQAAVNAATGASAGTVVAVNGPPGTGKTTLLRDVVASVLLERAKVLATFEDPERAFSRTGVTFSRNRARFELRGISPKLHGFELVVASSNNKAVENVSAELPTLRAVADDATGLRFFPSVGEAVHGEPCWGAMAAVLGNSSNSFRFAQAFWADPDRGLEPYLATAGGTPRKITDSKGVVREPEVVRRERPPAGRGAALEAWREARAGFSRALEASREQQVRLMALHRSEREVGELREAVAESALRLETLPAERAEVELALAEVRTREVAAAEALTEADRALSSHRRSRPGLVSRVTRSAVAAEWEDERESLEEERASAAAEVARVRAEVARLTARGPELEAERLSLMERMRVDGERIAVLERNPVEVTLTGGVLSGSQLARAGHEERQLATPWFDADAQRQRDALFEAAIALHKAFVDAAAEPLRHNLASLMRQMWIGLRDANPDHVRDLWASFALVVPVFSTTFASVEKMFRSLGPNRLGWLLLDEAGQATPQSAVGAILRADHVVAVGDPMQVEPVVVLPKPLTRGICEHFEIDPGEFAAPEASVQALADRASPYVATFESREGTRQVGIPLLVHRRCSEPMFGISNEVAYENLMVSAVGDRPSPIGSVLGPSAWFHLEGSAAGHWSPEEGALLLRALSALARSGVEPDLYVVTPFRAVAAGARELIGGARQLRGWLGDPWRFSRERVGTIHTVQGREAEAVIFVLGAPGSEQAAARAWAGRSPNLLNVAVTRAKERLYVIGNRRLWRNAGCFTLLDRRLPERAKRKGSGT